MPALPRIRPYGNYSSSNYGAHALMVDFDTLSLYYSYETIVAFITPETGRVVRVNDWQTTTGKHLNAIDGGNKKARISGEEFERKLIDVLKKRGLSQ